MHGKTGLCQRTARIDEIQPSGFKKPHFGNLLLQRQLLQRNVIADKKDADDGAGRVLDRVVVRHVGLAKQDRWPGVGLPRQHQLVGRVGAVQQGSQRAFPVLLLEGGGDTLKILAFFHKHRRHPAGVLGEFVNGSEIVVDGNTITGELTGGFVQAGCGIELLAKAAVRAQHQFAVDLI